MKGSSTMNIVIKSMSIDGYNIPVPAGLSELINRAGAWTTAEIPPPKGYRREVKLVNGRLITEYQYVAESELPARAAG